MDKQKINFIVIYALLAVCVVVSIFALSLYYKPKEITAEQIYKDALMSVVELKASRDDASSYGSAVCVGTNTFITNAHIIKDFDIVQIRFANSENYIDAIIEKVDNEKDLAIIKVESGNAKPVKFADTILNEGAAVYAIGNTQNYGISIINGMVSQREINVTADGRNITAIQCALDITDGNSGGALLNENGELIGITTFRMRDNGGNVVYGISFAIPLSVVIGFIG